MLDVVALFVVRRKDVMQFLLHQIPGFTLMGVEPLDTPLLQRLTQLRL